MILVKLHTTIVLVGCYMLLYEVTAVTAEFLYIIYIYIYIIIYIYIVTAKLCIMSQCYYPYDGHEQTRSM